ncbi:MAG: coenzyme-B sulfoethylthiotransferase subunit alpha [Candidatus Methanospirareceae archaeon]
MEEKGKHIKILEETFKVEATDKTDRHMYGYGGYKQSKRKREYAEWAKKIAKERGIPSYDPDYIAIETGIGVPLGQRYLEPVKVSGTDVICEQEDLHVMNNAALQQLRDDIFRTAITCLDLPHKTLTDRYGLEVTPETINLYMETINHTIVGGAVAQEHMLEAHPGLSPDSYVKIFTGNDETADKLDKRFLLDINKEFPEDKAKRLKEAIGSSIWQVSRLPTHALRSMDGAMVHRWNAMAQSMAFIASYRLCAGESTISDFAYSAKHAQYIWIGTPPFVSRSRGHNNIAGVPVGLIFDFVQHPSKMPDDPVPVTMEGLALNMALFVQWWYGQEMIGTVGVTAFACVHYNNDIQDNWGYYLVDWIKDKYGGLRKAPLEWDTIHECAKEATFHAMEEHEKYPLLLEHHWGTIRATQISVAAAHCAAWATGKPIAGALAAHYSMGLIQKEMLGRTGWGGQESIHHPAMPIAPSVLLDEGLPTELNGINVPFRSPFADSQKYATAACVAAHEVRMDAWGLSPVIKVAFADPDLVFDFRNIRATIAKGALREFKPAGERDIIIP